jgi:predicted  nucleic acid-binding Zn-ribbon protein
MVTTEELWQTLLRFHREIAMPDVRELVTSEIDRAVGGLRNEMNTHFDGMYKRFEHIDSELTALRGGLKRVEERLDALEVRMSAVEQRLDAVEVRMGAVGDKLEFVALRTKLDELRGQIAEMEQRMTAIESRR